MVSARTVVRLMTKGVGGALLAVSVSLLYQLSTTSITGIPLIGALTAFFVVLMVLGSALLVLS
ncbi:MAG: hypothetical protein QXX49_01020 [Candidatus Caldarchaeum sp.]|uniref:Uncharacterized protein n=1 Tax=Caldiarchaeum subterraneum TaxID=311458 RepID=A0A7J3VUK2_CALS0